MSQNTCCNGAANGLGWCSQDTSISQMDQFILYESWLAFCIYVFVAWRSSLDVRKGNISIWFGVVVANSAMLLYKGTKIGQSRQQSRTFLVPWAFQFFLGLFSWMISLRTLDIERARLASKGESTGKDKSLAVPQGSEKPRYILLDCAALFRLEKDNDENGRPMSYTLIATGSGSS